MLKCLLFVFSPQTYLSYVDHKGLDPNYQLI